MVTDSSPDNPDTEAIMAEELAKDGEQIPTSQTIEGEVTQPQAVQPAPQPEAPRAMTIRDTEKSSLMDPNLYIQMKAMAQDFINSKAIPQCWTSAAQVLVGLQAGLEMGMQPMEAMNSLYVVNGAVNVWGKATTRRLKAHGWTIEYSKESQESCTATIKRGREKYTETFTFDEAVQSGYTGPLNNLKIGWRAGMNRRKKLRYGVLAFIIATHVPEVLGSAVGIVEVSDDYDLGTNTKPAQLAAQSEDRKAKMLAAENKHKELTNAKFTPGPVAPKPATEG